MLPISYKGPLLLATVSVARFPVKQMKSALVIVDRRPQDVAMGSRHAMAHAVVSWCLYQAGVCRAQARASLWLTTRCLTPSAAARLPTG